MGAKEVAAGAQWLDENFPGWEREIDLGTLDIHDPCSCVLGQSLRRKAGIGVTGWGYGEKVFDIQFVNNEIDGETYSLLCRAFSWAKCEPLWRELIKERFSSGNLSDNGRDDD